MVAGAGIRGALVALACLAAIALVSGASAGAPSKSPPVTCKMRPGAHLLEVTARDRRERLDLRGLPPEIRREIRGELKRVITVPSSVTIERRIDELTVIDETERLPSAVGPLTLYGPDAGGVRSCGPRPTVTTTDAIDVRLGRRANSADLLLDLRYGSLGPGFTDEEDSSSEIEIDARLGLGGATVRMTRNPDHVAVARPPTSTAPVTINLNSDEPVPDSDLVLGRRSELLVDGGGGDDVLDSSGGEGDFDRVTLALVLGGQGADRITGGDGSDAFLGGPGRNLIEAGGGRDGVVASGRARDRIDCGPGRDFVFLLGGEQQLRNCERVFSAGELDQAVSAEPSAIANRVRELVRAAR
jgi:hypothetical protein